MADVLISDLTALSGEIPSGMVFEGQASGASSTVKVTTAQLQELARDTIGATLVAGSNITLTVSDAADTITIAAASGGGGGSSYGAKHPGLVSGRLYPTNDQAISGTIAPSGDEEVYVLFQPALSGTAVSIQTRVVTGGGTGAALKLALYADTNGQPGAKIVDLPGTLDCVTAGGFQAVTFTTPQTLDPNTPMYLGYIGNTATQTSALSAIGAGDTRARWFLGTNSAGQPITSYRKSGGSYTTGMPATPTGLTAGTTLPVAFHYAAQ